MKRIFDFCVPGASALRFTARIPFQSKFRKPELWLFLRNCFRQLFVVCRLGFPSLSLAISYTLPTFSASAIIHNVSQFIQKLFVHVASFHLFTLFIPYNSNVKFLYRLTNVKIVTISPVRVPNIQKIPVPRTCAGQGEIPQFLILLS